MLEMHMRQEYGSLLGRDHIGFRSGGGNVVRCVVDGDLVERFEGLSSGTMREVGEGMGKSVAEVVKIVEGVRHKVAF